MLNRAIASTFSAGLENQLRFSIPENLQSSLACSAIGVIWSTSGLSKRSINREEGQPVTVDWLSSAEQEIEYLASSGNEGGEPVAADIADLAQSLLADLSSKVIEAPLIDTSETGGISLDFQNVSRKAGVLIVFEPDSSIWVFANDGVYADRAKFASSGSNLRSFVMSALREVRLLH